MVFVNRRAWWWRDLPLLIILALLAPPSESFSARPILRSLILVDEETKSVLARAYELQPLPEERDKPDEDELEMLYPTRRQYFQFRNTDRDDDDDSVPTTSPVQMVRTTSFGCGKLGHQVWPSAIALSLALMNEFGAQPKPASVLELGAGCGLPSVVCRDVLKMSSVVATDFWYEESAAAESIRDMDRLIPEVYHGINLRYNVAQGHDEARVRVIQLDWHTDSQDIQRRIGPPVDLVIGSDLVYYPADVEPLWSTIESLLRYGDRPTKVILMAPLKPDVREAMPAFLELLEDKSTRDDFILERQGLYLYKSQESWEAQEDTDYFLKLSISLRS